MAKRITNKNLWRVVMVISSMTGNQSEPYTKTNESMKCPNCGTEAELNLQYPAYIVRCGTCCQAYPPAENKINKYTPNNGVYYIDSDCGGVQLRQVVSGADDKKNTTRGWLHNHKRALQQDRGIYRRA